MRWSAAFIALCMIVIAGSAASAAYLGLGFSVTEALAAGVVVLGLLAGWQAMAAQAAQRAVLSHQIAELSRGTTDLARQVGELGRRVVTAEAAAGRMRDEQRAAAAPLSLEIEMLGTLVTQLADSVAAHETALARRPAPSHAPAVVPPAAAPPRPSVPRPAAPRIAAQPAPVPPPAVPREPASTPEPAPTPQEAAAPLPAPPATPVRPSPPQRIVQPAAAVQPAAPLPYEPVDDPLAAAVRASIERNSIDLYLQPIVTLPQRKVRHYAALTRLRLDDGRLITESDYGAIAEHAGLTPVLDNLMLLRVGRVAGRLVGRNRDAALFYDLGQGTLADAGFFPQLADFLAINPTLAPSLVLGAPQAAIASLGAIEQESIAQLARLGVRFCMNGVTDLAVDAHGLGSLGIRFVKVPAALLLDDSVSAAAPIHASDLASLLSRFGIELIVEGVENEQMLLDLLDFDVRFGQGTLFSPPRPVRAEVFQGPAAAAAPPPAPAGEAAPGAPPRRREPDPNGQARSAVDRAPQGLAQLARNLMRRA